MSTIMKGMFIRILFAAAFAVTVLFSQVWTALGQTQFGPNVNTFSAVIEIPTAFNGTFEGESICVGNRPACRNEKMVYVFESVGQKGDEIMLTADFVRGGVRVPFFRRLLRYDPARTKYFSGRFLTDHDLATYGYDAAGRIYTVTITATDAAGLEGTISLTQDKTVVRRLKLKRVKPNQVPPAPSPSMYSPEEEISRVQLRGRPLLRRPSTFYGRLSGSKTFCSLI